MRPKTSNNDSGKSPYANLELVLFCPKHSFRVVKHAKKSHHVKLGIFLPIYISSLIKMELRSLSYEINHFSMAIKQIHANNSLNISNMHESWIL